METLAISLLTARPLACASFPVLQLIGGLVELLDEGKGIALHNLFFLLLDNVSVVFVVAAVSTATLRVTDTTPREALAVKFEALAFRALTFR